MQSGEPSCCSGPGIEKLNIHSGTQCRLLEWELSVCAEPGNLDGGTHILAVLRRCKRLVLNPDSAV
jgi:hypothetical protein